MAKPPDRWSTEDFQGEPYTAEEFVVNAMDLCMCGDPVQVGNYLLETLQMCADRARDGMRGDMTRVLALHLLDQADLTEHGGCIHCSWTTGTGERLLKAAKELQTDG
jgi:hypothetical protein